VDDVASNFYSALVPVTFTLRHALSLTGDSRAELAVELQFYGLLDRVMPYYAQEQIGVALLKSACNAGTNVALQTALATARLLVFEMGSVNQWVTDEFQDARYVITDRVVNGAPVWAAENGECFMYRDGSGEMVISRAKIFAQGSSLLAQGSSRSLTALTQLPSNQWMISRFAKLEPRLYTSARCREYPWVWVDVPDMHLTAVHGLDDAEPAMAATLRQLAALTENV